MKKIIAILHSILFLLSISSPFWINWQIVLIGFILYELQKIIFKGCLLSFAEFGKKDNRPAEHFTPYYLKRIFKIKASDEILMKYLDYILAPMIPICAIFLQIILNYKPIINIF